jgi:hypothetical protein
MVAYSVTSIVLCTTGSFLTGTATGVAVGLAISAVATATVIIFYVRFYVRRARPVAEAHLRG